MKRESVEIRFTTANTFSWCFSQPRFILLQINLRRSGDALVNHLKIRRNLQLSGTTAPVQPKLCLRGVQFVLSTSHICIHLWSRSKKTSGYWGVWATIFRLPPTRLDFNQKSTNNSSCITMLYRRTSTNGDAYLPTRATSGPGGRFIHSLLFQPLYNIYLSTNAMATKTHPNCRAKITSQERAVNQWLTNGV